MWTARPLWPETLVIDRFRLHHAYLPIIVGAPTLRLSAHSLVLHLHASVRALPQHLLTHTVRLGPA
jgi:hypothetical protein